MRRAAFERRSLRRWLAIGAATLLVAFLGLALLLAQARSRLELEERFAVRATLASRFVESFVGDIIRREQEVGVRELAGPVTPEVFERVVRAMGVDAAVLLDREGRVLAATPTRDGLVGTELASRYAHLATAVGGTPAVSNVVPSAARGVPVVGFAAPFEAADGRRVLSGAVEIAKTPISAYLNNALPFKAGAAYVIDSVGAVVATNVEEDAGVTDLRQARPELAEAMASAGSGTFTVAGEPHFFATDHVAGTSFRVVAAVPSASLYGPITGAAQWAPLLVLILLAAATGYTLRVLFALSDSQARLRAATAELARSNADLTDFASVASHDLQEPHRKIQVFGDRLQDRAGSSLDSESADYLDRMRHAAARMQALVRDLLTYSRLASEEATYREVDLANVFQAVLVDLDEAIRSTGARIDVGRLPAIDAIEHQMRQLFQNLITNALKFHRPGVAPMVTVQTSPLGLTGSPGRVWQILVADNGIGFDDGDNERIFGPFQRLHGRSAYEGTGIGLAICRRIVERHGGTIRATARKGEGAEFVITLPSTRPRE